MKVKSLGKRSCGGEEKKTLYFELLGSFSYGEGDREGTIYGGTVLKAGKKALLLLYKKECWIEMASICEQAYRTDFTIEEFTAYQMRALIALGQTERVLEVYEAYRGKLEE